MKKEKANNRFISMKKLGISILCVFSLNAGLYAIPIEKSINKKYSVELSLNQVTLKNVVDLLEQQTDLTFTYEHSLEKLKVNNVSIKVKDESIETILEKVLKGTNVNYKIEDHIVVLYTPKNTESNAKQQNKKITGVVKDSSGEPIIGANVIVKGTTIGVITDLDGGFSINVPENAVLLISYIGYNHQEITLNGQNQISVTLAENTQKLDEVVVTALGIKRQARSLGYSTTLVGGEDFTMARDPNLGNALSGKVAGVSVTGNATGSGGSSRVIIRGNASLTGNNMPLYVVDGVPFDNSNLGSAGTWGGLDMGDGLNNINADDIESIQVLKGAAASALYGYRGGNGAILITTKSGKKGKTTTIEFNNNLTFNTIYDYRDYQKEFGQGSYGSRPTDINSAKASEMTSWGEALDGGSAVNFLGNKYEYSYVDNWSNFYRTGTNNSSSLAISGAADKIVYRFGISNIYEQSILPNSNNSQQGINMNTTYDILSNIHLIVNANYVFEKFKGRSNLSDGNGNTNASLIHRGNSFDIRWLERGSSTSDWGTTEDGSELLGGTNVYFNNPYWLQYRKTNNMNKNRLTGAMTLKWDITDWLYIQGAVQRDGYNLDFKQVQPIGAAADPSGWLTEYSKTYSEINLNYLLGFDKKFGDLTIGATFGGNRQRNIVKQYTPSDGGRPFIVDGLWSVNNLGDKRASKTYEEYQVNSIYGTADFGWKNQIFLNLTGRNDWFSTLSPSNNHYFYPSATLSWVFSEALEMPDWFTFGKVRASYASASNGTSAYQNLLLYKLRDYTVNGQNTITQNNNNQYPNPELKPVRISEQEIGLNLSFIHNRLSFDMAYYRKNTKDDIAVVSTSNASGYGSKVMNVGEIQNHGFEFMMNIVPVQTADFMWNSTVNFAYNDSEVKYLGEGVERLQIDGASARSGNVTIQNVVGSAYGELIGYKYKRDESGNIVFKDGIAQADSKLSSLGNGVYKLTGGWSNSLKYKNFTLAFLLDFKVGAKLFSGTNYSLYKEGLHKSTLVGRTASNPNATIVGVGVMDDGNGNYVTNTVGVDAQTYYQSITNNNIAEEFIYNASFLKLRELSLGYEFPKSVLNKMKVLKGLNVSLVGRNLWTIIKHTNNIDPESAYNNSNGQGLELNGYPATRSIGFNVNVKF
ncbi:MAG: SusC/RagA family TonB-linked outer membrane protein [Massilibacteroides sp.]|nr:SusC/RagA family TonB-linked outer membrane protein [Massilibacteroides sp.]MDD3064194.1 SusC/RagA family TonB-linked outer membrane protein [Massilibacteroides sp.]MDD4659576.1 SusC/RagA family TonB-linked outer membrane protein [Massilibacteroides sp.]